MKKKPHLDPHEPVLSQRQYSLGAEFDSTTTNNYVARGIVVPDKIVSGRGKGIRLFTPLKAWEGRIISTSVKHHKMPLADAAEIADVAKRLATEGGFVDHWARALEGGRPFVAGFMLVTWQDDCYDAQIINGDKAGRPDFSSPKAARFLKQPFLVLPLSHLFEDVWNKCTAMLAADRKGGDV